MTNFAVRTVSALAAVVAATLNIAAATPAQARTREVLVHYNDLDLASPAGVAALETRVKAAARRVCRPVGRMDLSDYLHCYQNVRRDGLSKMPAKLASNDAPAAGAVR